MTTITVLLATVLLAVECCSLGILTINSTKLRYYNDTNGDPVSDITLPPHDYYFIDYHLRNNLVFVLSSRAIYKLPLDSAGQWEKIIQLEAGSMRELAVDWVHDTLYLANYDETDLDFKIRSCDLKGQNAKTIIQTITSPYQLRVDPINRLLLWQDEGTIQTSSLSGGEIRTVSPAGVANVYRYTLDSGAQRVYYIDTSYTLFSINYHGNDLRQHMQLRNRNVLLLGLWLVRGYIYHWMYEREISEDIIYRTSLKMNDSSSDRFRRFDLGVQQNVKNIKIMTLVDATLQKDPCDSIQCSHYCHIGSFGAECQCPSNMTIGEDKSTCIIEISSLGILTITNRTTLRYYNDSNGDLVSDITLPSGYYQGLDYHLRKKLVFVLSSRAMYKLPLDSKGKLEEIIHFEGSYETRELVVDWLHDMLYWKSCNYFTLTCNITSCDLNGKNAKIVIQMSVSIFHDLGVDPINRLLLWGSDGRIRTSSLTGGEIRTVSPAGVTNAYQFTLDTEAQLVYYTTRSATLFSISYQGKDLRQHMQLGSRDIDVRGVWLIRGYIYHWVYDEEYIIYRTSLKINDPSSEKIRSFDQNVDGITLVDEYLQKDPCDSMQCSHYCHIGSSGAECQCPSNMTIGADQSTCFACGGHNTTFTPLIVNGEETLPFNFPWHASLYHRDRDNTWKNVCGGSLIANRLVLTVAHCIPKGNKTVNDLRVALGKRYSSWYHDEEFSVKRNVST